MIYKKDKYEDNFTIIDNEYLRRGDLSARAKGILTYLLQLPSDWEVHKSEVQKHFTEGDTAFNTAFNELRDKGYIHYYREKDERGYFQHYYDVYEVPYDKDVSTT